MSLDPQIAASLRSIHDQLGDDFDARLGDNDPFERSGGPDDGKKPKPERRKRKTKAAAGAAGATSTIAAAPGAASSTAASSSASATTTETARPEEPSRFAGAFASIVILGVVGVAGYMAWPHIGALVQAGEPHVLAATAPEGEITQHFVIDGDTMYLEGSVPSQEASDAIEGAATDALGESRVINNFEISDDAIYNPDEPVQLTVAETVLFSTGRSTLNEQYRPLIELAIDLLASEEGATLAVVGHTDDVGEVDANLRLSVQRAQAVADLIVADGIEADRVTVDGRGESEPLTTNETPEGRAMNRRVEFSITGVFG